MGIFNGVGDLFTGGGGAPASPVDDAAIMDYMNSSLWSKDFARQQGQQAGARGNMQWDAQQSTLPYLQQLMASQPGYQRSLQDAAFNAERSVPWQYNNMGYNMTWDAQGNPVLAEDPNSTRAASRGLENQFLTRSGGRTAS